MGGTVEALVRTNSGEEKRRYRTTVLPVLAEDRSVKGINCVVEDITAREWDDAIARQYGGLEMKGPPS